ncbi:MAG: RecX family transcriptional regulator [Pelagibacteraceae bacterium]|jgi:regulatory protein|nr:RecX family transcriptional regulator [Pelagibacteraceae bacterium]HJO13911.1 RecX family transcriptional regulator [Alphaproteobacteria bacterium]MBO6467241.1 RecX family transcriptional regulator [Pelagibacteraceae bacterium]MBO6470011.1 RecX family transcriptional regulator [Pelagibacteraceae bacterium]MBO6471156.1 RecX family transcriptional regulator [Pelagibacteraceae bacterium]
MNNIIILKKYAFSYLSKYNTSKKNIDRILRNKVRRMNLKKKDKFILYSSIASILSDLENNKLIDDKNFTQSKIHSLSLQGKSKISIISYFVQKGIEKNLIEESFENLELKNPNWEKESAKIFARKKRLGIKYSANFEKDLAKMARAGFSYNLSKKILES